MMMIKINCFFLISILHITISGNCVYSKILKGMQSFPPPQPKYGFQTESRFIDPHVRDSIIEWKPSDENHLWELSGLDDGDIMRYDSDDTHRNGLIDETSRWINSTVPFYIDENDFTDDQVKIILNAINDYHQKTCIRFRPHLESDKNYIVVRGNSSGCWSSVGMKEEGQVVHLQKDGCVRHGIVVHEFLHALGFYHQQSATERDEYVRILYENIVPGREHNFNKYNHSIITNYNVSYDYTSVMHYSEKAFSKNGKKTIESLMEPSQKLGQRKGLSEKDIIKLNKMYETFNCHQPESVNKPFNPLEAMQQWFENTFTASDYSTL